jgi:hypothetical protein
VKFSLVNKHGIIVWCVFKVGAKHTKNTSDVAAGGLQMRAMSDDFITPFGHGSDMNMGPSMDLAVDHASSPDSYESYFHQDPMPDDLITSFGHGSDMDMGATASPSLDLAVGLDTLVMEQPTHAFELLLEDSWVPSSPFHF